MPEQISKWNSRLVAVAITGLATLTSLPGVDTDVRAAGVVAVTIVAVLAIAARDILAPARSSQRDPDEPATYAGEHDAR